jgi:hypothetical protein
MNKETSMSKAALEKAVHDGIRVVEEWKGTIAKITSRVELANLALANSKQVREASALKAEMGDVTALKAITQARHDGHNAEQIMGDLQHAMADAQVKLAEAETEAASARAALARRQVEILIRQRIDVAGEFDKTVAIAGRLYRQYEEIGREIVGMDAMPRNLHGISNVEGAVGARRVRASLPAFFWKLFPGSLHDEMKTENLATSEAQFWSLPDQPEAKAA